MVVSGRSLAALLVAGVIATTTRSARAETWAVPVNGRSIRALDRTFIPDPTGMSGWSIDPDGHGVRPPTTDDAIGRAVTVQTAPAGASSAPPGSTLTLMAIGQRPTIDPASVTIDVDAGQATVRGHGLRGMQIAWNAGGHVGTDVCNDPQSAGGVDTCTFAVARGLPADASQIALAILPAGARIGPDVVLFDAQGRRLAPEDYTVHPARVLVGQIVAPDATVDVQAGSARLHLQHGEAVGAVDCADAACDVDGNDLVIRGEHGANDTLEVHAHLRPHTYLQRNGALDANPIVNVPLQRCPVSIASAAPLRGIDDQNIAVRIGGACARDASMQFFTSSGPATVTNSVVVDDSRYVVIHLDRADTDEMPITVQRAGTVVGVAHAQTRPPPTARARLELAGLGPIDFIPTNRDAQALLPAGLEGATLVPVAIDGVYNVSRDPAGGYLLRGIEGTAGSVALRFAYRDRSLPAALRETNLALITEPTDRAIHQANVPVPLGASAVGGAPLVELLCGNGGGRVERVRPGTTVAIPYRGRDTCRIVLHRERLTVEEGAQAIHLTVDVAASDGTNRPESHIDQRIVLHRAPDPRYIYITGVQAPFDRVIVRVSVAGDDAQWAISPDEHSGAPQVQWAVVMGTDHFRIYATAAIPTGLFRVSDPGHGGIMTLNAGALLRLVYLSNEGHESPVGLEAGVMWVAIAGEQNAGSSGQTNLGDVAIVAGAGIGVPIANQSRVTQASINLHAWFEYEVTRLGTNRGTPIGFVFGPSISIGDVGANF